MDTFKNDSASWVASLSPQMALKAEKELNETPEKRARDIQALREMVQAVPNLNALVTDEFLLRFLRARKFNRDRALKLVIKYYKIKASCPSILGNMLPSKSIDCVKANILSALPYKDQYGRRIALFNCAWWDPSKHTLETVVKEVLFALEVMIRDENVQVTGFVAILDLECFGWRHLQHIRPSVVSKLILLVQDSFPGRFKGFHVIRESVLVDIAYAVFKQFLNTKLKKRVVFHGWDMSSLHKHISPSCLPPDYGGEREPLDKNFWPKLIFDNEELFQSLLPYGFTKDPTNTS